MSYTTQSNKQQISCSGLLILIVDDSLSDVDAMSMDQLKDELKAAFVAIAELKVAQHSTRLYLISHTLPLLVDACSQHRR